MDEGILSLKWNNHTSSFIHKLSSLHKVELYSDVTLACDGKYFAVHKLVLSVCSEYFEEILSKTKCQHPVIVLKDIRHSDLEVLLNYMYSGEANVSQSELSQLIKAAECLRIKGLAVPDEPPQKEKRRHSDSHKDSASTKRRRREESPPREPQDYQNDLGNSSIYSSDRLSDREDRLSNSSQSYSKNENEPTNDFIDVKQEPKLEPPEPEEIDLEGYSLPGDEMPLSDDHLVDSQQPHMLQDPSNNPLAGPSGLQDDSLSWNQNYSNESFPGEDGSSQPMGQSILTEKIQPILNVSSVGLPASNSAVRPHSCPLCPKGFYTNQDLRRHLRTHTGEKPFHCDFCPYKSSLKGNLKKHVFGVHINTT